MRQKPRGKKYTREILQLILTIERRKTQRYRTGSNTLDTILETQHGILCVKNTNKNKHKVFCPLPRTQSLRYDKAKYNHKPDKSPAAFCKNFSLFKDGCIHLF